MALTGSTNSEKIFWYFKRIGMPAFGICGLLGNLDCESGLNPSNLEDSYERKLGFTNETYTRAVDNGSYSGFIKDCAGYGIAQWTWWTRKQNMLNFAKSTGSSIGDLEMQLDFLKKELQESFPSVWNTLMNAKSVYEASNAVLLKFECPADQSVNVQNYRASVGQEYYNRFKNLSESNLLNHSQKEETAVMGYYTFTKGSNVQLSKNFRSREFDCHGSGCCTQTKVNEKLVKYLQMIRDHFGTTVTITSAYRCAIHNRNVGGATGSRHCVGDAADIVVANHAPKEVAQYAESIGILGIGLYETNSDGFFVHIDTRNYKSFWYGQAQSPRTTFGAASNASANNSSAPANLKLIKYGDSGNHVKNLQESLIKLGFACGSYGADGSFGLGTKNAVLAFQKENNLAQDGIAGELTLNAIKNALSKVSDGSYRVEVTATVLNVRSGAGTNHSIVSTINKGQTVEVVEELNGWGKISNPNGWISLDYCVKR